MKTVDLLKEYNRIIEAHMEWVKMPKTEKILKTAQLEKDYIELVNHLPDNEHVLNAYGGFLYQTNRPGLAVVLITSALNMNANNPDAWLNLGLVLNTQNQFARARIALQRALQLNKSNPEVHHVLGKNELDDGNPELAISHLDYAIMLDPNHSPSKWLRGVANLYLNNWLEGWEGYQLGPRENMRMYEANGQQVPEWQGERGIPNLVVYGEQGLGDEILFGTCLRDLRRVLPETEIVLDVNHRLVPLFQRSFPDLIVESSDADGGLKYNKPLTYKLGFGSLPYYFRNSSKDFPPFTTYLRPDPARRTHFDRKYRVKEKPMIGFAWLGGVVETGTLLRSIPLEDFARLFEAVPDAYWLSLQYQKDIGEQLKPYQDRFNIIHDQEMIDNIDDQVAAIAACDLVVTVTMSVCDFAGSIGRDCWTLVPSRPLWRFSHKGESRLWYKSERLFRQSLDENDWNPTIDRVSAALKERFK